MEVPAFEIFSGFHGKDARWVETVQGLAEASERMKQLARQNPGPYFVFDLRSRRVLDFIHTRSAPSTSEKNGEVA
jgi:hypothetical protein